MAADSYLYSKYILTCAFALAVSIDGACAKTSFEVLYSFMGGSDGETPDAGLIMDSSGNLYGTTMYGGNEYGTVFKLAPDGTESVLHAFAPYLDGSNPEAKLLADKAGNLYGTTSAGGDKGSGTVFKLAPDGSETILYSFCTQQNCADGSDPVAELIADKHGNFYGTTWTGGSDFASGTVFELAPDGEEKVLHSFTNENGDGALPEAGLLADKAGNLYGTTCYGGEAGFGTVFKLAPDGTETVLHAFEGTSDGAYPQATLIADGSGNFYGTTSEGGATGTGCPKDGCGTIFKLAPDGTETILHVFTGAPADGAKPLGVLIADKTGNLYGTTEIGGRSFNCYLDCGIVFRISSVGKEAILHTFTSGRNGDWPAAGLIRGNGYLYGTTTGQGEYPVGNGNVFKLEQ